MPLLLEFLAFKPNSYSIYAVAFNVSKSSSQCEVINMQGGREWKRWWKRWCCGGGDAASCYF